MTVDNATKAVAEHIATAKADVADILVASVANDKIEAAFKNSYVYRIYLKDDSVSVSAKDGVVTLTGTVAEESRKAWAADTAAALDGVSRVENKLETTSEAAIEKSDKWIYRKVKLSLLLHQNVSATSTKVDVTDGVVTLSGPASNSAEMDLASEYANDIDGVKTVKNEMLVATAAELAERTTTEKIDDASVTAHVRSALNTHRSTRGLEMVIVARDGTVFLTGIAKSAAEKSLVTKRVAAVHGVKDVKNEMTVDGCHSK